MILRSRNTAPYGNYRAEELMSFDIDTADLEGGLRELSREQARELAGRAFTASSDTLVDAGDDKEWDTYPVVQSGVPPEWDSARDAFVFSFRHAAAVFFEVGTEPHEIEAVNSEFLAFDWPDAPDGVREQFEDSFPTVFFRSVQHPGTPALRYVERGLNEAARDMGFEP